MILNPSYGWPIASQAVSIEQGGITRSRHAPPSSQPQNIVVSIAFVQADSFLGVVGTDVIGCSDSPKDVQTDLTYLKPDRAWYKGV